MKQQVNLADFLPQKQHVLFSSNLLLKVCGLFLAALLVAYGISYWQITRLSEELKRLQYQETSTSVKVVNLANKILSNTQDEKLKQQVIQLREVVKGQEKIMSVLQSDDLVVKKGFSGILQAFTENILPGAWLDRIDLSNSGKDIYLGGFGTSNQVVISQLNKLNQSTNFKGWRFKLSEMHKVKQKDKDIVSFIFRGTYE